MPTFWILVLAAVLLVLVLAWQYDRRVRAQGRSPRSSKTMGADIREVRRDARVAVDQAAWSRTAAGYTSEQLAERQARRDRQPPT